MSSSTRPLSGGSTAAVRAGFGLDYAGEHESRGGGLADAGITVSRWRSGEPRGMKIAAALVHQWRGLRDGAAPCTEQPEAVREQER